MESGRDTGQKAFLVLEIGVGMLKERCILMSIIEKHDKKQKSERRGRGEWLGVIVRNELRLPISSVVVTPRRVVRRLESSRGTTATWTKQQVSVDSEWDAKSWMEGRVPPTKRER